MICKNFQEQFIKDIDRQVNSLKGVWNEFQIYKRPTSNYIDFEINGTMTDLDSKQLLEAKTQNL